VIDPERFAELVNTWHPYEPCPCGCEEIHQKLKRNGHVVGCRCRSCIGTRNRRKGHAAQAKGHRALGGVGFTPTNEESTGGYPIRVQVEHKTGYGANRVRFDQFIETAFFKEALKQAKKALRVGDGAMPGVMLDGRWLIVDTKRNKDGAA
jgi:hypothetical protein